MVLELDSSNNQLAFNIQGTNLIARTVSGATLYYMYNGHADVTALIDASGTIQATYYYDAFGNLMTQTGNVNNPFTYAGYQYDNESGLYYLNARYYDPVTARFITEDTYLGDKYDPLSLNLYTYCHNEPIMYVDPSGHTEAQLRDLVAAAGGEVGWNNETRTATATINGVEKKFKIEDFKVEDGRIIIDSAKFDSMFSNNKVSISSRVESKKITATMVTNSSGSNYGGKTETISSSINNYQKSSNLIKPVANGISNNTPVQTSEANKNWFDKTKDAIANTANDIYKNVTKFHFEDRDALNVPHLSYSEVMKRDSGWALLDKSMSIYHDNGVGEPELKFINPDGREAVFDGDTLQPVTDSRYKATYNYVTPVQPPENMFNIIGWGEFAGKGVGHFFADMVPYYLTGNKNERNQGK